MATPAPQFQRYGSPKRKRGAAEPVQYSPIVSPSLTRLVTDLKEYPFQKNEDTADPPSAISPRSKVAGQLQKLDLQEQDIRTGRFVGDGVARKRFAQMISDGSPGATQHAEDASQPTSTLSPTLSTSKNRDALSRPPSSTFDFRISEHSSAIVERPRLHRRSPSLDGDPEDHPLTWQDSEITGHNPTDPSDDGYGINGIGFKPSPAIAWARSQRRKQQLAEYKNREAREARQRRSERRRLETGDPTGDPGRPVVRSKTVRVRFDDS